MKIALACLSLVTLLAACGNSSPSNDMGQGGAGGSGGAGGMSDMTASCDLALSPASCTIPMTATGNSKGVGAYCDATHTTCPNGTICANNFFPGATFCTIAGPCMNCGPMGCVDTATCGENTVCVYSQQFSAAGCVPAQCAPATHC